MTNNLGGVLLAVGLGLQSALASTGWVERLEIRPPTAERFSVPEGVVLRYGDGAEDPGQGEPALPTLIKSVPAWPGFRLSVRVVETEFADEAEVRVAPTLKLRRTLIEDNRYATTWVRESDGVTRTAFWPESLARVDEAWQGTNKVARLAVRPVQWNAQDGALRVHSRLVLDLVYQPE